MKKNNDLVSVIIPTCNRALACEKAVKSVLAQTHERIEVIIVDDGSQDNTKDVLCEIDGRVTYVTQANAGVSAARNRGLEMATGAYIAFLDSDDEWLPWKLEAQLCVLNEFPEAGMVWSDMKAVSEQGIILQQSYLKSMYSAYEYFDREAHFRKNRYVHEVWKGCPEIYSKKKCYIGNIFSRMFMGNLVHTSTVVLRRERQMQVGFFDINLKISGEDYDYHFRTCRAGEVAYIDVPSILYRVGAPDQLTSDNNKVHIAENNLKTVVKMLKEAKNEIILPRSMIWKRVAEAQAWFGMEEFGKNKSRSRSHLLKSLVLYPFQFRVAMFFFLSFLSYGIIEKLRHARKKIKLSIRN